jgi:glyoxylase-like metal-dependent hydrolase (beta-lactamase superfamily II)
MTAFTVVDGVYGIDIGLFDSGVTSVYLFDDEEPTLIDAGTANSAGTILAALEDCGMPPEALSNVVVSHVHTDHSGAVSTLVERAPELDIYIHELTASHLIDPSNLVASSRQAMGEHFQIMGEQGPVPEENVIEVANDGTTIDIGANTLELIHAPGHSPDHFAVWNPERRLLFAAECLGAYFEQANQWLPTATLPNFDVAELDATIDRLSALDPKHILFPHFGVWPDSPKRAFELAETELHRYDEQVLEFYKSTGSVDDTRRRVADGLLNLSPPYTPIVEDFFANLLVRGFLTYHDIT